MKSNLNPWMGSKITRQPSDQKPPEEEKKCIKVSFGKREVEIEINIKCVKNQFFRK